jgi:hypothetical protein
MLMLSGRNYILDAGVAILANALATNHHLLELHLGNDATL